MKEELCWQCKKTLIVNPCIEYGPTVCQKCSDAHDKAMTPKRSRLVALFMRVFDVRHRHIVTRGFDPYAGDEYRIKIFGKDLLLTSVISFQFRYGKKCWNEYDLLGKLLIKLFMALDNYREWKAWNNSQKMFAAIGYYEDPMGELSDYE